MQPLAVAGPFIPQASSNIIYHYSIGPGIVNEKNAKAKSDKKIRKAPPLGGGARGYGLFFLPGLDGPGG